MSDEGTKKITKKHRKSERKEKGSKVKKSRKSGPEAAEDDHGQIFEGHQRFDPSIAKFELMKDSTLPLKAAKSQLSSLSSGTSPNTVSKVKVLGKRKRTDHALMRDESVDFGIDATELEPLERNKRRGEDREEGQMHRLPCPDPAVDESLSEQSRRALSYAYEQCRGSEAWKFNKARQNWLLRNVWSEHAVSEDYIPLVIKYLVGIRGGAREKLIGECISKMSTPEDVPMQGAQPFDDSAAKVGSTTNRQPNASRALSILRALDKSS